MQTTISPVCVSCQSVIGHVYAAYYLIEDRRKKIAVNKAQYSPMDFAALDTVSMGDVLDKMNVKNLCCRKSVLGHSRVVMSVT
jgi:DNA-directed RNA polymerase subunit N (RpoN/RPB10)